MAEGRDTRTEQGERAEHEGARRDGVRTAADAANRAMAELRSLTGKEAEGVIGLERTDEGWTVTVEALELRRVPNTTDVLATYAVDLDRSGDMVGYRRVRRYVRGAPDEE